MKSSDPALLVTELERCVVYWPGCGPSPTYFVASFVQMGVHLGASTLPGRLHDTDAAPCQESWTGDLRGKDHTATKKRSGRRAFEVALRRAAYTPHPPRGLHAL